MGIPKGKGNTKAMFIPTKIAPQGNIKIRFLQTHITQINPITTALIRATIIRICLLPTLSPTPINQIIAVLILRVWVGQGIQCLMGTKMIVIDKPI